MRSRSYVRHGIYATGLLCLGMLVGCKSDTKQVDGAAYGHREMHIGSHAELNATERATYQADRQYLHSLMKPDVPVRLNMADDRQYRFVLTRMRLAGKNPKNSPHLFELIAQRRQKHLRINPRQGLAPAAAYALANENGRQAMHFIETAASSETANTAAASSTFPGGSYYTYVDSIIYETNGQALSEFVYIEDFDGGAVTTTPVTGDLNLADVSAYSSESYKMEDTDEGFDDSYIFTRTGAVEARDRVPPPEIVVERIEDPIDKLFDNGIIRICLSRGSPADCDYPLLGVLQVKVPLRGTIRIITDHHFDEAEIDNIRTDLNNGLTGTQYGQIKLVLGNIGGGCDVQPDGSLAASMKSFWNTTTVSADGKSLSWNMTGNNTALFDESCRQVQDYSKLTMRIPLPILDDLTGTIRYVDSVTISNDPDAGDARYVLQPIQMVNSCLAEGTMIRLADGRHVPIETIQVGDRIFNSYRASSQFLTVTDMAKGTEDTPMVRIVDASGKTLLMTEKHPIQTPDRGMVMAKYLKEGDTVMTKAGPSQLTEVTREKYAGKVYNLKVGAESEMAQLNADQTAVYANGFLVGDGQIQSKYETLELTQKEGDIMDRLPKQWHRDYLNWAANNK